MAEGGFNLRKWKTNSPELQREIAESESGTKSMNDLPVVRDLRYAQGILGSPGGKHWKSLERNIWREVVPSSKAVILNKEQRIFTMIL